MIKKIKEDNDMPVGKLTKTNDFLPPPHRLIFPESTVKVTIFLTKSSLDFFKKEAKRNKIKYQKMIREIVDRYAKQYADS